MIYKDGWYCIGDKDFTYHRAHKKSVITRGRTWEKKDYGVRCTLNSFILQYVHITEIVGIHCHRITSLFMIVKGCIQLNEFLYTDREQQMLTMVYKDGWYGRGDRDFT